MGGDVSAECLRYLPDEPYQFHVQFGKGTLAEFWGPTPENAEVLAERAKWLRETGDRCLVWRSEAATLLVEAAGMGVAAGVLPASFSALAEQSPSSGLARAVAEHWEPDFLLMARSGGSVRLAGGCVCFPSSWSVQEKIGRPIEEIHAVVPGLNASIGPRIQAFLERLKPGISWTRSNWGLSRSRERNQHPARALPRLDESVPADEVYFRVEEQSLIALPESRGVLFGIRIKVFPLRGFIGTEAGGRLSKALETMPEPMANYKGLARSRARILSFLR